MGDIKQLTRRPGQPDGQQLLRGASGLGAAAWGGQGSVEDQHRGGWAILIVHPGPVISARNGSNPPGWRLRLPTGGKAKKRGWRQLPPQRGTGSSYGRRLRKHRTEEEEVEDVNQLLGAAGFPDPRLNISVSVPWGPGKTIVPASYGVSPRSLRRDACRAVSFPEGDRSCIFSSSCTDSCLEVQTQIVLAVSDSTVGSARCLILQKMFSSGWAVLPLPH